MITKNTTDAFKSFQRTNFDHRQILGEIRRGVHVLLEIQVKILKNKIQTLLAVHNILQPTIKNISHQILL